MENIVVIGGGQAAAVAAYTLRQEGYSGTLHVVSDEQDIFYERPPLSKQNLLAPTELSAIQFYKPDVIAGLMINWHLGRRAVDLNTQTKVVRLCNGDQLVYDKLLLATGSSARVINPAWQQLENVHELRSFLHSHRLRECLEQSQRLVVIGGGWIGLEVAASARQRGLAVTVLERGEQVCGRSVTSEVAQFLQNLHQSEGVEILTHCGAIELAQGDSQTVQVFIEGELHSTVDAVLVAAGAQLNTELACTAGLDVQGAVVVNEYCQTSEPDIYAAGDVAIHPALGISMQSWAHAQNQGATAAKHMVGKEEPYQDIPWLWSDQYDCNIQMLGTPSPSLSCVMRESGARQKTFFYFDEDETLRYVVAVNDAKNIKIAKRWMQRQVAVTPEQVADLSINLMAIK
ncbi:NAD(P)/FAD-dependent oxidoreductase [Paenalcaligenes hominis]|uniref:NAD(P)/FAD-dependent oxidoreductase n=1 Tax=Paenalcaligenes hominis TaxID=643674 RepID=UPI003523F48F